MIVFNIDVGIVVAFLIITLAIGLYTSRNVNNIAEYALASKSLSSGLLAVTILATYITGSKGIGYAGYVFDDGILPVLPTIFCGVIGCFLLIIYAVIPNIHYFDGCLTTAALMGQVYGRKVRVTVGILGSLYSIVLVVTQMIWLGGIGEVLGISKFWSLLLGGLFLVLYAARGGIKSVTMTDLVQLIAVTVMIPMIAYVVMYRVGGLRTLVARIPSRYLDICHHPHTKDYLIYCIWYFFPAFPLSFPFIQRMLMAKDKQQLTNSYCISMLFLIAFFVVLTLIGFGAIVLRENGDVHMPTRGSDVITYLVNHYFFSGAKGILAVGLISAVMSTADSFLNSAGLLLVHDVIRPYFNVNELKSARYVTFGLGMIALLLVSINTDLPRVQYVGTIDLAKGINIGSEAVALIFTIPLIAAIVGLRGNVYSFFIPTIFTAVAFIFGKLFFDGAYLIPVSILINLIIFLIVHYLINNGFKVIKREKIGNMHTVVHLPLKIGLICEIPMWFKRGFKKFVYNMKPSAYSCMHADRFALFMIFYQMLSCFMGSYPFHNQILWLRIVGGILCIGLLLRNYWPPLWKSLFPCLLLFDFTLLPTFYPYVDFLFGHR